MNRHASMNRAFRLIWSAAHGDCLVAPETASGRGGKAGAAISISASITAAALCAALLLPGAAWSQSPPATVVPVPGKAAAFAAPNGVPVVNINTANGAGLSHNQYIRYDVDQHGLVLNNSQALRQSQLAGAVARNPNLNAEAKVILNEVVSSNRSSLAGFTEVLGGKADVIVANPYGITCSGCGFINSDRVTLSTGTPNFGADGGLAGFNVSRGDVLINGAGLNASAQKILDIVTRSVRIDGQVNTSPDGSLGIVAGTNAWSYGSREVTGAVAGDAAAKPAYAIDSSALGGMYAGRIRIVATEAGVGVRMLGDAAASTGDFLLDAAGKVQMQGRASAARDLRIAQTLDAGAAALEVSGASASLTSGRDLVLSSAGGVMLDEGLLKAGANLALQAQSLADTSAGSAARSAAGAIDANIAGLAAIDGSSWNAGASLALHAGALTVGAAGSRFYSGEDGAAAARGMRIAADGDLALGKANSIDGQGRISGGVNAGTDGPATGALSGSFDKTGKTSASSDAVVADIAAGKNLSIRTSKDARIEGANLQAGGDASLDVGGKLDIAAAQNTKSSSEEKIHGAMDLSATKSESKSTKGMALEGEYEKKSDDSSKAVVANLSAGGKLALATGGDARLEGAQLKAKGDTGIDVKGNLKIDAARDTSRSEALGIDGKLNMGSGSQKDTEKNEQADRNMFGLGLEGKYEKSADDKAVTAAVGSGGNLRMRAGGDAEIEGADLRAGGQAAVSAGRDLSFKAAQDKSESTKLSGELNVMSMGKTASTLDRNGQATPATKAGESTAGLALSGDHATSDGRRGVTLQSGAGGAQLSAGKDLAMEGGSVKSGGDVNLAAGGDINLSAATSKANSIGGSLQAGRESASNSEKPDQDSAATKFGAGLRGGLSENHEGTAITGGGQIRLESGGKTSMTNTETKAGHGTLVAADKGVTKTTLKDRNQVIKQDGSVKSKSGGTAPAEAPKADWKAATPAKDAKPAQVADAGGKPQGPVIGAARKEAKSKKPVIGEARKHAAAKKPAKPANAANAVKPVIGSARQNTAKP